MQPQRPHAQRRLATLSGGFRPRSYGTARSSTTPSAPVLSPLHETSMPAPSSMKVTCPGAVQSALMSSELSVSAPPDRVVRCRVASRSPPPSSPVSSLSSLEHAARDQEAEANSNGPMSTYLKRQSAHTQENPSRITKFQTSLEVRYRPLSSGPHVRAAEDTTVLRTAHASSTVSVSAGLSVVVGPEASVLRLS